MRTSSNLRFDLRELVAILLVLQVLVGMCTFRILVWLGNLAITVAGAFAGSYGGVRDQLRYQGSVGRLNLG